MARRTRAIKDDVEQPRVAGDAGPDDDSDFIGPRRFRDKLKAGLGKFGTLNKKIQGKFAARREKYGKRGIGGY